MAALTKDGKHGKLYRYAFEYGERDGYRLGTWFCWAYDFDNAMDLWHASNYDEGFWLIQYAKKDKERPAYEWTWHKIPAHMQTEGAS